MKSGSEADEESKALGEREKRQPVSDWYTTSLLAFVKMAVDKATRLHEAGSHSAAPRQDGKSKGTHCDAGGFRDADDGRRNQIMRKLPKRCSPENSEVAPMLANSCSNVARVSGKLRPSQADLGHCLADSAQVWPRLDNI